MAVTRVKTNTNCTFDIINLSLKSICCAAIARVNLSFDGKRIRWLNDFDLLKLFIANVVKEQGKWSSPRGKTKRFTSSLANLTITWYQSKQRTLLFQSKSGHVLRAALIQLCEQHSTPFNKLSTSDTNVFFDNDKALLPAAETFKITCGSSTIHSHHKESTDSGQRTLPHTSNCDWNNLYPGLVIQLENMQLDIEILKNQTNSLQSIANSYEFPSPQDEIKRLKKELSDKNGRIEDLESELSLLSDKRVHELEEFKIINENFTTENKQLTDYIKLLRDKLKAYEAYKLKALCITDRNWYCLA